MRGLGVTNNLRGKKSPRNRIVRPQIEGLESRLLLYSTLGDMWTYDSRITYSFMPDGTSVGGTPSALFKTMNANYPTATWQQQFEQAAALWEGATNVNLALVSDGGQAVGVSGDQQDDPRFGDIRIGAIPLASGVLAETFLPPPANGGTDAGDILFNSNLNWQINSTYDIMTVAAHEIGHALGLGDSTVSTAVMYGTYNGIKQALTTDDISGIESIYGTRQFDQFNNGSQHNSTYLTATNLNSYITSTAQISLPGLDITTSNQSEWFTANVPSTTTGTMTVTAQSSNLSSLAPKLQVYNSSLGLVGQVSATTLGATISLTVSSVQSGQQYYFKVLQAGGPGPIGGYGLLVNFGNQYQAPIQPPNTVVPQQPDQGGGVTNNALIQGIGAGTGAGVGAPGLISVGSLQAWAVSFDVASSAAGSSATPSTADQPSSSVTSSATTTAAPGAAAQTAATQTAPAAVTLGTTSNIFQAVDAALEILTPRSIKKAKV
ncbi:MAG: matrixin family metalloprotease [Isosphaeraceae bacterium]